MFKIVKTKDYKALLEKVEALNVLHDNAVISVEKIKQGYDKVVEERDELKARLDKIEADTTEVTMKFSDDAAQVTPVVKYNPDVVEKLIELGYLNDATAKDKFAVQITMMTIAADAIDQILESFTEDVKEA